MGTNSKVHLQFKSRFWRDQGCNGETYSDRGYQNTWEVTRAQDGTSGILSWYTGGNVGVAVGSGTPQQQAKTFLKQIEPVLPGATAKWNGQRDARLLDRVPVDEGLVLVLEGRAVHELRRRREPSARGNCYFCGEHTSHGLPGVPERRASNRRDAPQSARSVGRPAQ